LIFLITATNQKMIKIEINVKKLDFTRVRKGSNNPNNEYLTLTVRKLGFPDKQGNEYSVAHAMTLEERQKKAKTLYVGNGRTAGAIVTDEDPNKFWMIYLDGGGAPTAKHPTLSSATHEAHRLAKETGRQAFILELAGVAIPKEEIVMMSEPQNGKSHKVSLSDNAIVIDTDNVVEHTCFTESNVPRETLSPDLQNKENIKKRKRIPAKPIKNLK
jgi:hypothetical protein